jgi:hypothetical protein
MSTITRTLGNLRKIGLKVCHSHLDPTYLSTVDAIEC